mgnify:CR=1 FL=1|tara:strand:- start:4185 stop:4397 length:213 start_codon:yes stop_codon:yes gene_type:complete
MSGLIPLFVSIGYLLLAFTQYGQSIVFFALAIFTYSLISFIEYARLQLRTNQFTDGQQAAINTYNEETKS